MLVHPERTLWLVCIAFAAVAPTNAEEVVYFEQSTWVQENGQSLGAPLTSRVWLAGQRMRLEAGPSLEARPLILRLDLGKGYRIEPARREALEFDLETLQARSQLDLAAAGDLIGDGGRRVRTRQLDGLRTIAGYECSGYRIRAASATWDIYVSPEVPVSIEAFADFLEWTGASMSLGGVLDEIRKLPGFPLETRSRVELPDRVQETVSTVTAVRVTHDDDDDDDDDQDQAGLFEPPEGYRVLRETQQEH